ncbi:MAG: zinc dependent phospholipase C family protein [bacterium]|nr:zinc dependent phospholipase C family protein [bacterium]
MAGSFLHLHLAIGAFPAAFGLRPEAGSIELPAFLAGSLAPDVGFFPGGPAAFSHRVHHERTGDFVRLLLSEARGAADEAFVAGWALHTETDAATHPLINRLAAAPPRPPLGAARQDLWHKRIEWGLDCRILGATGYQPPLWQQPLQVPVDLLIRSARSLYGVDTAPLHLRRGLSRLADWIGRLARILFWSGSAARGVTGHLPSNPGVMPGLARVLARRLEGIGCMEDLVAILTPEFLTDEITLQALDAGEVAVAAFQRGWVERFVNILNRDLDSGQVVPQ